MGGPWVATGAGAVEETFQCPYRLRVQGGLKASPLCPETVHGPQRSGAEKRGTDWRPVPREGLSRIIHREPRVSAPPTENVPNWLADVAACLDPLLGAPVMSLNWK